MADEITQTKDAAGAYVRFALEARKKFIAIRERQDPQIRSLYIRLADRVAASVSDRLTPLKQVHLKQVEQALREEADKFRDGLSGILKQDIKDAVEAGSGMSSGLTFKLLEDAGIKIDDNIRASFFHVNKRAVEAMWHHNVKGLKLSDRIWQKGEKAREDIQAILEEAVATGQSAVDTAKLLKKYVRKGARTLAIDYPQMMARMEGRIPNDMCYEALRLARTETSKAYWNGTIESARASPSYQGMKWILSRSHSLNDICNAYADHDEGLGRGVYAPGNEPSYPHPNCICTIVAVHEQPEEFVARLKRWRNNPSIDPKLEKWYSETYKVELKLNNSQQENWHDKVKNRIVQGVKSDLDVIDVGSMISSEIEVRLAEYRKIDKDLRDKVLNLEAKLKRAMRAKEKWSHIENELIAAEEAYYKQKEKMKLRNLVTEVLGEVRPLGNTGNQMWAKGSNKMAREAIAEISRHLPSDWHKMSNATELLAKKVRRGYHRRAIGKPGDSWYKPTEIALRGNSVAEMEQVALHEMGHRMETVVQSILTMEQQFYERRTAGYLLEKLKDLTALNYGPDEVARRDKFTNPYMGKDYKGKAYEILSMGLEGVFFEANNLWSDKEYVNFILGVMAAI
ncbi:hypothetical protein Dtox_4230 [Desulfofarcimen acetoxidans DSM 771]|uniref:Phage head morphogenesis domain-containing protein n=1 Tax=Desulfofarcimen acetoxidans (strain ATCC 49208 / DSM 771 / KCTC 5769 / VKM B-1644 / 5575) TaxID=485916 RepID=C8VZF2_DESAS|nr:hypothetical protein [Desulfofarcimen acetoxidans]ACV64897.1 hypothetical protein Dtox_4230 [Desulfofarcimen acetoxidans DSM 771]